MTCQIGLPDFAANATYALERPGSRDLLSGMSFDAMW